MKSFDLDNIYHVMTKSGIVTRFERLVSEILQTTPNLILVYVYHPEITHFPIFHGLPPASVISKLLTKFSPLFYDVARKHSIPIIDLSLSFNPYSKEDYGSTPIEPSNMSGEYIADLIVKIINEFDFGNETAKAFYKPGGGTDVHVDEIADDWTSDVYGKKLKDHLSRCKKVSSSCEVC
eukprot:TRINITY_DN4841_c0_g1_i2.p1 TRINITY_DN4841_c0_g1~~TRINITY_DN4841_c0_g1_i2.p1  ORF type:complete len:179 (+),score=19.19 TRINITY_DN4841_c0_g1_i2:293-829(+)